MFVVFYFVLGFLFLHFIVLFLFRVCSLMCLYFIVFVLYFLILMFLYFGFVFFFVLGLIICVFCFKCFCFLDHKSSRGIMSKLTFNVMLSKRLCETHTLVAGNVAAISGLLDHCPATSHNRSLKLDARLIRSWTSYRTANSKPFVMEGLRKLSDRAGPVESPVSPEPNRK